MTVVEEIKENSILNSSINLSTTKEAMNAGDQEVVVEENMSAKGGENDEVIHNSSHDLPLEDIKEIISAGTQALALSNYDEAAEKLSIAVEAQVNALGPLSIEIAPTYYLYGCALFHSAVQKSSVLGEKADQVKPTVEGVGSSTATTENQNFVFAEIEEDLVEEYEDAQNLQDIEVPPSDDLELAWETLDCARVIYEKEDKSEYGLQLADVHVTLGDVSLESENFDEAVKDYEIALKMRTELVPESFRELAEVHFKLSLALEYSEQNEAAVEQVQLAMSMIKKRIDLLESKSKGKGREIAATGASSDSVALEIKELEGFLSDLSSKLSDINSLLEKEGSGESISAIPVDLPSKPVSVVPIDISKLVKKRKTDHGESSEKKIKSNEGF